MKITKHGVILRKTDFGFENEGVLNPAAIRDDHDGGVHLFYRAVSKGNYSSIGYCKLSGPLTVESRADTPILFPQTELESHGIEDPRITKIDGVYYLSYTAYDGVNALGSLATSVDLVHFEKRGLVVAQIHFDDFKHLANCKGPINEKYGRFNDRNGPLATPNKKVLVWDKNVMFFPERIDGRLYFLHRIKPDIQVAAVNELADLTPAFWENHFMHLSENVTLAPKFDHEVSYLGGGCPPIKTEHGWLLIYHGVYDTTTGYVYTACAALLDLKNPCQEIARLPYPLFKPELDWELHGEVNNVCFPTGAALFDDTLYIYYGAADSQIACASVSLSELLSELLGHKK